MKRLTPLALVAALGACNAVTVTPPLSSRGAAYEYTFSSVRITSGKFRRPHQIIGVFQVTQAGYKWFHEVQVIDDANPDSLLYKIGNYAMTQGAQGIQHAEFIDLDPQTEGEKTMNQINSAINISRAVNEGQPERIAGEGTKTRWEVRGELVVFTE